MTPQTLRIDELLLRLPSLDETLARQIAGDVAVRVAAGLGAGIAAPAETALHVRIPSGTPPEELAETIARRILEALR